MIRITITPAAFEAIAATLPSSVGVEQNRAPNGDRYVCHTLVVTNVDRLARSTVGLWEIVKRHLRRLRAV